MQEFNLESKFFDLLALQKNKKMYMENVLENLNNFNPPGSWGTGPDGLTSEAA